MPLHLNGVRTSIGPNVAGGMTFTDTTGLSTGNVSSIAVTHTNLTAGINNLRTLTVDLTMGANCAGPYAGYFRTTVGANQVGGLGAAFGIEIVLPSVAITTGEYHGMTIDVACTANSAIGAGKHSFLKMEIWGDTTAKNAWDDGANLFFLNGLAGADDNMFDDSFSENTPEIEASLRININGTSWWIPLMDNKHGG